MSINDNYPPGVSNSTFGSPWNDIEEDIEFTIKVTGSISLQGPLYGSDLAESINDAVIDIKKEIKTILEKEYPYFEFEV